MNLESVEAAIRQVLADEHSKLVMAAQAVVEARYYGGDDGWDRLKNAIGDLEQVVGRR